MVHPPIVSAPLTTRAEGWSQAAIAAGFVATIGMTVVLLSAYLVVRALGNADAGVPRL